jgi:hypothetical protein
VPRRPKQGSASPAIERESSDSPPIPRRPVRESTSEMPHVPRRPARTDSDELDSQSPSSEVVRALELTVDVASGSTESVVPIIPRRPSSKKPDDSDAVSEVEETHEIVVAKSNADTPIISQRPKSRVSEASTTPVVPQRPKSKEPVVSSGSAGSLDVVPSIPIPVVPQRPKSKTETPAAPLPVPPSPIPVVPQRPISKTEMGLETSDIGQKPYVPVIPQGPKLKEIHTDEGGDLVPGFEAFSSALGRSIQGSEQLADFAQVVVSSPVPAIPQRPKSRPGEAPQDENSPNMLAIETKAYGGFEQGEPRDLGVSPRKEDANEGRSFPLEDKVALLIPEKRPSRPAPSEDVHTPTHTEAYEGLGRSESGDLEVLPRKEDPNEGGPAPLEDIVTSTPVVPPRPDSRVEERSGPSVSMPTIPQRPASRVEDKTDHDQREGTPVIPHRPSKKPVEPAKSVAVPFRPDQSEASPVELPVVPRRPESVDAPKTSRELGIGDAYGDFTVPESSVGQVVAKQTETDLAATPDATVPVEESSQTVDAEESDSDKLMPEPVAEIRTEVGFEPADHHQEEVTESLLSPIKNTAKTEPTQETVVDDKSSDVIRTIESTAMPSIPPRPRKAVDVPVVHEQPAVKAKPAVPARPSKVAASFLAAASTDTPPPPKPKPKPAINSKIGALRASLFKDLDSMIARGPPPPGGFAIKKPEEEAVEGSEDVEKPQSTPTADARRGRAKGPKRRLPASAVTKWATIVEPVWSASMEEGSSEPAEESVKAETEEALNVDIRDYEVEPITEQHGDVQSVVDVAVEESTVNKSILQQSTGLEPVAVDLNASDLVQTVVASALDETVRNDEPMEEKPEEGYEFIEPADAKQATPTSEAYPQLEGADLVEPVDKQEKNELDDDREPTIHSDSSDKSIPVPEHEPEAVSGGLTKAEDGVSEVMAATPISDPE